MPSLWETLPGTGGGGGGANVNDPFVVNGAAADLPNAQQLSNVLGQGTHAARPAAAAGNANWYYFETDTQTWFQSTGAAWVALVPDIDAANVVSGTLNIARIPTGTDGTHVPLGGVIAAAGPIGDASHTPAVTVNTAGQVTTLGSTAIAIDAAAVTSGTLDIARIPTGTDNTHVPLGGVIAATGPIGSTTVTPVVTVNTAGQVTALTSATIKTPKVLFSGASFGAVGSISTTASLIGGPIAAAIPGNSLAVGDVLMMEASGRWDTGGAATMYSDFVLGTPSSGFHVNISMSSTTTRFWTMRLNVGVSALGASQVSFNYQGGLWLASAASLNAIVLANSYYGDSATNGAVFGTTQNTTANIAFDVIVGSTVNSGLITGQCSACSLIKIPA